MNPFQPYCQISKITLDDVPVVEENLQFYDAPGDFFLCYDVAALKSCVVSSSGSRLTEWKWNPGYAVQDLQQLIQSGN